MEIEMLIIHGRNNSSNVQKVVWSLNEMDVPYERIDAGGSFGIVNKSEYLAMNPNARVPTMDDQGFILWESNAIIRYLAAKYDPGGLHPLDSQNRASADRWMDWQQTTVVPLITPIFWNLIRTPEAERDLDVIENCRKGMIKVMKIMNDNLDKQPYMISDQLTMADIPLGVVVYRWLTLIQDRPEMPKLESWYKTLSERTAFKTHILDIPLT